MSTLEKQISPDELLDDLISKLDAQLKYVMVNDFEAVEMISEQIAVLTARITQQAILDDPRYALKRRQIDALSRRACVSLAAKCQELARELEKVRRGLKYAKLASTGQK